jgi:hypothetical protein
MSSGKQIPQQEVIEPEEKPERPSLLEIIDVRRVAQTFLKVIKRIGTLLFLSLILYITWKSSLFIPESGYVSIYNKLLKNESEMFDKNWDLKMPFSSVVRYKKVLVFDFGNSFVEEEEQDYHQREEMLLRFSDDYQVKIPITFFYQLPSNKKGCLEKIHQDFTHDKLIYALLLPVSHNVVVNTAMQYKGEEIFQQNGLNQFRMALLDQLQHGIYKTKPQQEIKQKHLTKIDCSQQKSVQNINVENVENIERVEKKSLDYYGIEVIRVALGMPIPGSNLKKRLAEKRSDESKAAEKESKKEETEEEQTAQLARIENEAEIQLAKIKQEQSIQSAQHTKELDIIEQEEGIQLAQKRKASTIAKEEEKIQGAQKKRELALANKQLEILRAEQKMHKVKKEGELALAANIAKAKKEEELKAANANLKIQEANFKAAEFEAKAILAKGLAEAKVLEAKYKARDFEIYQAEIQKEIAQIIYPNLKGIEVTMPHNIVNLGEQGNNLQTNLDVLSSFATIGVMEGLEKKALKGATP